MPHQDENHDLGLTVREIAEQLGISEGQVSYASRTGMEKLRATISGYDGGEFTRLEPGEDWRDYE